MSAWWLLVGMAVVVGGLLHCVGLNDANTVQWLPGPGNPVLIAVAACRLLLGFSVALVVFVATCCRSQGTIANSKRIDDDRILQVLSD